MNNYIYECAYIYICVYIELDRLGESQSLYIAHIKCYKG